MTTTSGGATGPTSTVCLLPIIPLSERFTTVRYSDPHPLPASREGVWPLDAHSLPFTPQRMLPCVSEPSAAAFRHSQAILRILNTCNTNVRYDGVEAAAMSLQLRLPPPGGGAMKPWAWLIGRPESGYISRCHSALSRLAVLLLVSP